MPFLTLASTVAVEVDIGTVEINALEATIIVPDEVRIEDIQTGNSAINLWVMAPKKIGNLITFAGVTPGGLTGKVPLLNIIGDFNTEALEQIQFEDINALQNDGAGTPTAVKLLVSFIDLESDYTPPEDFKPMIASDSQVFDGEYFLVFSTPDQGSGINHYEIKEGDDGVYREAASPYLIGSQNLDKDIYVKAVDNAGNEKVEVLPASTHNRWWGQVAVSGIIILLVLAVVIATRKAWVLFVK